MVIQQLYPWHHAIYQQLTESFLQGRGHHALLFKTEKGLGTKQLIHHFAHWLLCQQPQGNQPCYQCKSCLLWQSHNHPDFHHLVPIDDRDIGVEQVRELNILLQQYSQQGGNIGVHISSVDRLTESAANALLKTLEEPHNNVYFLLQMPLQSPILATIQSRCQSWVIHTPQPNQALHWLQQECPHIAQAELEIALRVCHYRPLLSKQFIELDRLTQRKAFFQTFWRFYKSGDLMLLLTTFDKEDKAHTLQQLEWLASFFSDSLKAKLAVEEGWINTDLAKGVTIFSQQLSAQALLKGYQVLQQTQRDLMEINGVNHELMLADCLSKLILSVFEQAK